MPGDLSMNNATERMYRAHSRFQRAALSGKTEMPKRHEHKRVRRSDEFLATTARRTDPGVLPACEQTALDLADLVELLEHKDLSPTETIEQGRAFRASIRGSVYMPRKAKKRIRREAAESLWGYLVLVRAHD